MPKSEVVIPDRAPDLTLDDYITPVQNLLYRLTGDTIWFMLILNMPEKWDSRKHLFRAYAPSVSSAEWPLNCFARVNRRE